MKKPALVILAAGMGSRYGGLKQIDGFGPNEETILEYSIYDAIQAGFGKIVFVVRLSFIEDIKQKYLGKFDDLVEVCFVTQELDELPAGFFVPDGRSKPWGTAHAVYVAKDVIDEPFAVINADDYYGQGSYSQLVDFLQNMASDHQYCIVSYYLKNTLSEYGSVNRGICHANEEGNLTSVVECTKISKSSNGIISYPDENGVMQELSPNTLVSMNMLGFMPSYFSFFERDFSVFLENHGRELTSEFYIPTFLDKLNVSGEVKVALLSCDDQWFGVTYQEDKPFVQDRINDLIEQGVYPKDLWKRV